MTESTLSALSRLAAVAAGAALLLAVWFGLTARGTADDSPAAGAAEERPACLLGVDAGTVRLNSAFLAELEAARIAVRPIAPAGARSGRSVAMPVRGASGVPCDANAGVIGMRGGLELVRGQTALPLRRWRILVGEKRIETRRSPEGAVPIFPLTVDLAAAERIVIGGDLSLRASALLGEGGSAAINRAFGTRLRPGMPVARLALAVREVSSARERR
jgi:hypothetical protein